MLKNHLLNTKKESKNLNKLNKACFQHDMAYREFKDLAKRTASYKVLRDKAFNFVKNPKHDGYQSGITWIAYKFVYKSEIMSDKQLAEELHKLIIKKFVKQKVYSHFKDNIWGTELADMQLINKFNKIIRFLLCVIDIHRRYTWVVLLKDKKGY